MSPTLAQSLVAFIVLAALILLNAFGILSPVLDWGRISTGFIIIPFVKVLYLAKNFGLTVTSIRDLASQNEILTSQVQKLTADLAFLEKTRDENKVLRESLGFQGESRLSLIPAEIISFDSLNQKAVLKAGTKQGIAAGDSVVVSGSVLVGVISQVSVKTSEMELVTSSGTAINAKTASGKATGIVRGEHGLGLLFDQVSRTESLKPGDRVVTSGLGGKYQGNLFIGTVGEIRSGASELFQTAGVVPAADLRNLQIVFVVKKQ